MPRLPKLPLLAAAALLGALCLPALAASSASSASSDSASTSVGSVSNSFGQSSDSSSKGKDVAAGDYKVIEIAAAPQRPGIARLRLQAANGGAGGEFFLYLPQQTAQQSQLASGDTVTARERPYGLEFAKGPGGEAFFLVMDDAWYRELKTRVVTL